MQKAPSQVTSGNIAPAIAGPDKDMKDVYALSGLVLILATVLGAFWYYSSPDQLMSPIASSERLTGPQVSAALKNTGNSSATPVSLPIGTLQEAPLAVNKPESIHIDLYFDIGRKGLTDEGKAQLAAQADLLKQHQDFGVLIQGYTDQQGSASYNKKLGLQRAETVKAELLNAGVDEHRMKVVSLGEEGVLCVDTSDVCRHMNRRVHLEIRTIGQEHMATPAVAATVGAGPAGSGIDSSIKAEETGSLTESLLPFSSSPAGTTPEPIPGS